MKTRTITNLRCILLKLLKVLSLLGKGCIQRLSRALHIIQKREKKSEFQNVLIKQILYEKDYRYSASFLKYLIIVPVGVSDWQTLDYGSEKKLTIYSTGFISWYPVLWNVLVVSYHFSFPVYVSDFLYVIVTCSGLYIPIGWFKCACYKIYVSCISDTRACTEACWWTKISQYVLPEICSSGDLHLWRPVHLVTCALNDVHVWRPVLWVTCTLNDVYFWHSYGWAHVHLATRTAGDLCTWRHVLQATCTLGDLYSWRPVHLATCTPGNLYTWKPVHLATCALGNLCQHAHQITCTPGNLCTWQRVHLATCISNNL